MANVTNSTIATPPTDSTTLEVIYGYARNMPTMAAAKAYCFRYYAFYVICCFGLLSNIIILVVLGFSKRMRKSVSGLFLMVLAVADNLVLMTQTVANLLRQQADQDQDESQCPPVNVTIPATDMSCTAVLYLKYVVRCIATFIVVCISVHRFVAVVFPLSPNILKFISKKAAIIQIAVIVVLSFIASVYATNISASLRGCYIAEEDVYQTGVTIVDIVLCDIVASVVITVLSIWTVCVFVRSGKQLLQRQDTTMSVARKKGERHMTVLLLTVAFSFIIMRLPYTITWLPLWFAPSGVKKLEGLRAAVYVTECFSLLNHAIHLYLYCICSHGFREEMKAVFTRGTRFTTTSGSMRKRSLTNSSTKKTLQTQIDPSLNGKLHQSTTVV